MQGFASDYLTQLAAGGTLAVVSAMAYGLRRWARGHEERVTEQFSQLRGSIGRVYDRVDAADTRQREDHDRIVRVETALLLAPTPRQGSEQAFRALNEQAGREGGLPG